MRFTTSEEPGDPYAHIRCRLPKRFGIIIEEGDHVLTDIPRDDIFLNFLLQYISGILVYLNDAIDLTVDVVIKHFLYSHLSVPPTIHDYWNHQFQ